MLAPNPSQHLESETTPLGNPLFDSAKLNLALGVMIQVVYHPFRERIVPIWTPQAVGG
jgi:hypothetical protein